MSVFLAFGYRLNKYIYSVANQEFFVYFYSLDLAQQELNENGFAIVEMFYDMLYKFDQVILFFQGPRWLYHKDPTSFFFVRSFKDFSLGQDIYVADSEPWIFDGAMFWCLLLPQVYLSAYLMCLGGDSFSRPLRAEWTLLYNISLFQNIKILYNIGTASQLFNAEYLPMRIVWGSGHGGYKAIIFPSDLRPFLNSLNPYAAYILF